PDALKSKFDIWKGKEEIKRKRHMKLADLLLDQTFVAGIGNKYNQKYCSYKSSGLSQLVVFLYLNNRGC
ncbi:MAG: hypothetical protein M3297_09575, partial [Thermoproteota archaeon]|nr:hypothetical protein [Thermoproteota archaeon]